MKELILCQKLFPVVLYKVTLLNFDLALRLLEHLEFSLNVGFSLQSVFHLLVKCEALFLCPLSRILHLILQLFDLISHGLLFLLDLLLFEELLLVLSFTHDFDFTFQSSFLVNGVKDLLFKK